MPTNGQKRQKMTNNCKISEITIYGEKMTQIYNNVKKCQKWAKTAKKCKNFNIFFIIDVKKWLFLYAKAEIAHYSMS